MRGRTALRVAHRPAVGRGLRAPERRNGFRGSGAPVFRAEGTVWGFQVLRRKGAVWKVSGFGTPERQPPGSFGAPASPERQTPEGYGIPLPQRNRLPEVSGVQRFGERALPAISVFRSAGVPGLPGGKRRPGDGNVKGKSTAIAGSVTPRPQTDGYGRIVRSYQPVFWRRFGFCVVSA